MNLAPIKIQHNKYLLFIIILISILLRFYNFFSIPYTFDEFGIVSCLRFNTFHELLTQVIMVDGHPAGITTLTYYWMKLVGTNPSWVKLPFLICGVLSVYLIWLIAQKWFNQTVAIITSSYIAFLYYYINYSQTARPYISGLFFVLLMVYAWTNLLFDKNSNKIKNYIVYIIASSLCTYNHHFSMLFAFIVGVTGLFYCSKNQLKYYILSGIAIFVLYIPHLKILFTQLSIGGLGWLSTPSKSFFIDYIFYLFQFSFITLSSIIVIILYALYKGIIKNFFKNRFFIISIVWFILPLAIGLSYSYFISPVIQYSMLIFSSPFLFLALFSLIPECNFKQNALILIVIILCTIPVLIFQRQYYSILYNSFPDICFNKINKELATDKKNNTTAIVNCASWVTDYYINNKTYPTKATNLDSLNTIQKFNSYLKNLNTEKLIYMELNSTPREYFQIITQYYTEVIEHKCFLLGDYYVFSKHNATTFKEIIFSNSINLAMQKNTIIKDKSIVIDSTIEYGPSYSIPLYKIAKNKNNIIDLKIKVRPLTDCNELSLVLTIFNKDKQLLWRGNNLQSFSNCSNTGETWLYLSSMIPTTDIKNKDIIVNAMIWNNKKSKFLLSDFSIQVRYGNPIIYSSIEANYPPFDKSGY